MKPLEIKIPYLYETSNGKRVFIYDKDNTLFVGSVQGEKENPNIDLFHDDGRHVYDEKFNLVKEIEKVDPKRIKK